MEQTNKDIVTFLRTERLKRKIRPGRTSARTGIDIKAIEAGTSNLRGRDITRLIKAYRIPDKVAVDWYMELTNKIFEFQEQRALERKQREPSPSPSPEPPETPSI